MLRTLAKAEKCSIKELDGRLAKIRRTRASKQAPPKKSLVERLEDDFRDSPFRIAELRPFAVAFENGVFLPTVKSIQRFLEANGVSVGALKSRRLAGPLVLKALANLNLEELSEVRISFAADGESDFSLLSEAILGRDGRKRENP